MRAYRNSPLRRFAVAMLILAGALLIVGTTVPEMGEYPVPDGSDSGNSVQTGQGTFAGQMGATNGTTGTSAFLGRP